MLILNIKIDLSGIGKSIDIWPHNGSHILFLVRYHTFTAELFSYLCKSDASFHSSLCNFFVNFFFWGGGFTWEFCHGFLDFFAVAIFCSIVFPFLSA